MEKTEYKAVRFAQDFYNDITADEINDVYDFQKQVKKEALKYMFAGVIPLFFILIVSICMIPVIISMLSKNIVKTLLNDGVRESIVYLVAVSGIIIDIIYKAVKFIKSYKHFYFAKGTIIDLESEFYEADKAHPDGYWKHTITLAVTETECLKNIFYFDDKKWEKENYIGESAVAVYFPNAHLMYAIINGEDAENFDKFSDEMFKKKNKAAKN